MTPFVRQNLTFYYDVNTIIRRKPVVTHVSEVLPFEIKVIKDARPVFSAEINGHDVSWKEFEGKWYRPVFRIDGTPMESLEELEEASAKLSSADGIYDPMAFRDHPLLSRYDLYLPLYRSASIEHDISQVDRSAIRGNNRDKRLTQAIEAYETLIVIDERPYVQQEPLIELRCSKTSLEASLNIVAPPLIDRCYADEYVLYFSLDQLNAAKQTLQMIDGARGILDKPYDLSDRTPDSVEEVPVMESSPLKWTLLDYQKKAAAEFAASRLTDIPAANLLSYALAAKAGTESNFSFEACERAVDAIIAEARVDDKAEYASLFSTMRAAMLDAPELEGMRL